MVRKGLRCCIGAMRFFFCGGIGSGGVKPAVKSGVHPSGLWPRLHWRLISPRQGFFPLAACRLALKGCHHSFEMIVLPHVEPSKHIAVKFDTTRALKGEEGLQQNGTSSTKLPKKSPPTVAGTAAKNVRGQKDVCFRSSLLRRRYPKSEAPKQTKKTQRTQNMRISHGLARSTSLGVGSNPARTARATPQRRRYRRVTAVAFRHARRRMRCV